MRNWLRWCSFLVVGVIFVSCVRASVKVKGAADENLACQIDFDGSGMVDMDDIRIIAAHWREDGKDFDLDGDGTVTVVDIMMVSARLGDVCLLLVYEAPWDGLKQFMADDLGTWAQNFTPWPVEGIDDHVFKTNISDCAWVDDYADYDPVIFKGGITLEYIEQTASQHPGRYWIFGEEPNWWYPGCVGPSFGGKVCNQDHPSPQVYAHWWRDVSAAVLRGWAGAPEGPRGKLIGFFFVQDDLVQGVCGVVGWTLTADYLDKFKEEWISQGWGEVPMDGICYNHRPICSWQGEESFGGGIAKTTAYWQQKQAEMQARPWLQELVLWGQTNKGLRAKSYEVLCQNALDPDLCTYCDVAKRLVNLVEWGEETGWFEALLWWVTSVDVTEYPWWMYTTLYYPPPAGSIPVEGDLSPVGEAFRSRGVPDMCQ